MAAPGKAEGAAHRLINMVVEEVSLVDRAANKHRFLIVKRSDPMDETQTTAPNDTPAGTTSTEPADEAPIDLNATTDDDGDDSSGSAETAPAPASASALEVAAKVLESISGAVEMLGSAPEAEARAQVSELAKELQEAAERLSGVAGVEPGAGEARPNPPTQKDTADFDAVLVSVRTVLEQVKELLEAASASTPTQGEDPPAEEPKTASASTAQLDEVVTVLRSLGETVKEQQQRLARMEKRFGLPNSAPTGEHRERAEADSDIGWPLDLNRSLDRDSVDKAISFHDV